MGILAALALRGDWNGLKGLFPALISGIFIIHFAVGIERKRQSTWTNCSRPWVPKERKMSEQMEMRSLWLRERSEPGQDPGVGQGRTISLSPSGRS